MKKQEYKDFNVTLYSFKASNGMNVYLLPKNGFKGIDAFVCVNFGSFHSDAFLYNENNKIKLKNGLAHFLEHRLFEKENGSVFEMFSINGANVNAFTTYDKTMYYFTASKKTSENINSLLDLVSSFSISDNELEKEKNIIIEEIKSADDDPLSTLYKGIMGNMYHSHKIKDDVIGSIEDIKNIVKEDLLVSYNFFYHPSKLSLVVSGNFDVEEIRKIVLDRANADHPIRYKIELANGKEPSNVVTPFKQEQAPINNLKCILGFKLKPLPKKISTLEKTKAQIGYDFLSNLIFSEGEELSVYLIDNKITTSYLNYFHDNGMGYNHLLLMADILDYEKFYEVTNKYINNFKVKEENLRLLKKGALGNLFREIENPSKLGFNFAFDIASGGDFFLKRQAIESLEVSDLEKFLEEIKSANKSGFLLRGEGYND